MAPAAQQDNKSIADLLESEISVLKQLEQSVAEEYAAITSRDTPSLEQALAGKRRALEHLHALEQQRAGLLSTHGAGHGHYDIEAALRSRDPSGRAIHLWKELLAFAQRCRDRNRLNYALVELGSAYTHDVLRILRGEDPDAKLYGPGGGANGGHDRRSIARA